MPFQSVRIRTALQHTVFIQSTTNAGISEQLDDACRLCGTEVLPVVGSADSIHIIEFTIESPNPLHLPSEERCVTIEQSRTRALIVLDSLPLLEIKIGKFVGLSSHTKDSIAARKVDVDDDAREGFVRRRIGQLTDVGEGRVVCADFKEFNIVVSGTGGEEATVRRESTALHAALAEGEGVGEFISSEDTNSAVAESDSENRFVSDRRR